MADNEDRVGLYFILFYGKQLTSGAGDSIKVLKWSKKMMTQAYLQYIPTQGTDPRVECGNILDF